MIRNLRRALLPRPGRIDFGDFDRVQPISKDFGWDRGTPVDRVYVERFLDAHRHDVRGRVLEIGDASYSQRFDSGITQQDVLHVDPTCAHATIIGDLSQPNVLPPNSFDCLLITQTLHLIFDLRQVAEQLYESLVPGGVLLLTVPGITPTDRKEWKDSWFWSMTALSVKRLFAPMFNTADMQLESFGNVYAATCFLQGLAVEEIDVGKLATQDPAFPVVVGLRARKAP